MIARYCNSQRVLRLVLSDVDFVGLVKGLLKEVAISLLEVMSLFSNFIERFVSVVVGSVLVDFIMFQWVFDWASMVFPELLFKFRSILVNFLVQYGY